MQNFHQQKSIDSIIAPEAKIHSNRFEKLSPPKKRRGWGFLLTPCFGLLLFIFIIFFPLHGFSEKSVHSPPNLNISSKLNQSKSSFGSSLRLSIPSIEVDAAVENVSLLPDGTIGTPSSPKNVGWFDFSSWPGEQGSAVITGHFDGENGTSAIFNNLHKLNQGDKIFIEDNKGTSISFAVERIQIYNSDEDTSSIFKQSGDAYLNLITCNGIWDKTQKNYTQRLVIFAKKID